MWASVCGCVCVCRNLFSNNFLTHELMCPQTHTHIQLSSSSKCCSFVCISLLNELLSKLIFRLLLFSHRCTVHGNVSWVLVNKSDHEFSIQFFFFFYCFSCTTSVKLNVHTHYARMVVFLFEHKKFLLFTVISCVYECCTQLFKSIFFVSSLPITFMMYTRWVSDKF